MPSSRARKTASSSATPPSIPPADTAAPAAPPPPRKTARRAKAVPAEAPVKPVAKAVPAAKKARARKTAVLPDAAAPASPPAQDSPAPVRKRAAPRKRAVSVAEAPVIEAAPPLPRHWSEVGFETDAWGRRLVWRAADEDCPAPLVQRAAPLLDEEGGLDPQRDEALLGLHALAAEHGHELRIDPAAWAAVAACRDVRWRAHHLEQAYPEGPDSAALGALWPDTAVRLAPFQREGALFAACAGRCLLADEPGLDTQPAALLAALLLARHFGVQRVRVACAPAALPRWQQQVRRARLAEQGLAVFFDGPGDGGGVDLLIADDRGAGLEAAAREAMRPGAAPYAVVLCDEPQQRPEALADWLAVLDPHCVGPSRRFLQRHRAADGQWTELDRLHETLNGVMLRCTRVRWLQPVPGRRDRLVWLPAPEGDRERIAAAVQAARPVVERWRRVRYVSDQDQVLLHAALDRLFEPADPAAPAKVQAMREQSTSGQVLVLPLGSMPAARRTALQERLLAAGLPVVPAADGTLVLGGAQGDAVARRMLLCATLPTPVETVPDVEVPAEVPRVYLLHEGGVDELRLLLQACDSGSDRVLTDPVPFRQGAALTRRMEALALLTDRAEEVLLRHTR